MERHAVVAAGIHHDRKSTRLHGLLERLEMLFAELGGSHRRRSPVLAGHRHAIAHEMLCTCSDVVRTDMVRIITLHTSYLSDSHLCIDICIFAETLPHTRPCRISAEVHCRRESPWDIGRTALICRNLSHIVRMLTVEGGGNSNFLREKGSSQHI